MEPHNDFQEARKQAQEGMRATRQWAANVIREHRIWWRRYLMEKAGAERERRHSESREENELLEAYEEAMTSYNAQSTAVDTTLNQPAGEETQSEDVDVEAFLQDLDETTREGGRHNTTSSGTNAAGNPQNSAAQTDDQQGDRDEESSIEDFMRQVNTGDIESDSLQEREPNTEPPENSTPEADGEFEDFLRMIGTDFYIVDEA